MTIEKQDLIKRLYVMGDIKQVMLTMFTLEETLTEVLQLLQSLIPFTHADITAYDYDTQEIHIITSINTEPLPLFYENTLPLSFSNHPFCQHWQEITYIPELNGIRDLSPIQRTCLASGTRSLALASLYTQVSSISKNPRLGAISIGSDQPDAFDSISLDILEEVATLISLRLQQSLSKEAQRENALNMEALVDLRTAELQEMIEQLAEVNKQKNEFMAAVSHELRTPLNAILGKAENLQEEGYGALTTKQQQATQVIIDNSYKLLTLINNILDISHLESDRLSLYLREVDVVVVCHEILVRIQQIAQTQKIRVVKNIPTKQILMTIDEDRFRQILFNLLDNAIKFNHAGGEIGLDILEDTVAHCVHFVVWDTGIGISPDMIDFIFMLFTQVDGRLARQYEGTGLGLPLAYRLTQLHDGQLTVTSEVDVGSRFTVTLPTAFTTIETAV